MLANDILIIAIAPLLIAGAQRRGLDPAAVRDRAGRRDQCGLRRDADRQPAKHPAGRDRPPRLLAFSRDQCGVPALFALVSVFAVVWLQWQPPHRASRRVEPVERRSPPRRCRRTRSTAIQMIKAGVALLALLILFSTPLPREIGALIIAALLLANRRSPAAR